jgi:hypothetical protein
MPVVRSLPSPVRPLAAPPRPECTAIGAPGRPLAICGRRALASLLLTLAIGCAKVTAVGLDGTGGGYSGGGTGANGTSTTPGGTGASSNTGGRIDGGLLSSGNDAGICQQAQFTFDPKIPTVFILVDQSGSMFKCRTNGGPMDATGRECANRTNTSWYPLRDGVLQVLQPLQGTVRFGFAAFTGEMGDAMCPTLLPVIPALGNYDAISSRYTALLAPRKGETPTRKALDQVGALLMADAVAFPGDKFILFVTDGEPDYCDDGNATCPPDSVIAGLQNLKKANVSTLVMGISSPLTTISDGALQAFANAGAGQPVFPALPAGQPLDVNAIYDQCSSVPGWHADFLLTGKPAARGSTIADYATVGGTASVYKPDVTNQIALVNEISRALSGVKSCTFDLNNVSGKALKVNLQLLARAHVLIEGNPVPLDDTNGWKMATESELDLVGTACDTWRNPASKKIDFQFPCELIVPE